MTARVAYTLPEAAAAYGPSESWLRRQIREGRLPHSRAGRRILVRASDLDELLPRMVDGQVGDPQPLRPIRINTGIDPNSILGQRLRKSGILVDTSLEEIAGENF